jgi:hypothetical protein
VEGLSEREREEIVRLSAMGLPSRLIGQQIGRHHRTVWGHLQRLRQPVVAEPIRSPLRLSLREREEISRGLAAASRAVRSHEDWGARRRRSRERSPATVMRAAIGPVPLIELHSLELGARRSRSWRRVPGCEQWSSRNSRCGGHRNRSRVG